MGQGWIVCSYSTGLEAHDGDNNSQVLPGARGKT